MSFLDLFAGAWDGISKPAKRHDRQRVSAVSIESLEERLVLYSASGNEWPDSRVVTISIVPDGTNLGGVYSNLISNFDSKPVLAGRWMDEIKRAAQDWAKVTNLNFVFVSDNGAATGSGSYQQGDPNFGDIRIGGFDMGTAIAGAFMPPDVNNYSLAGDITFNTNSGIGIGSGWYDLYTVASHEIGHALGLNHSTTTSMSEMWAVYNGEKPYLANDDISGIQSIYGTRLKDSKETASGNQTINDATNIAGELVHSNKWAIIDDLDIQTTSDVDFYRLAMPAWTSSSMVVTVQSAGFSQLAPKITIYDKDKTTVLGTINGSGQHGTSLSLTINGCTGTDVFYIKIESAETNSFGVGAYGITLDLGASPDPVLTPPNTTKANGNPLHSGGGSALSDIDELFSVSDVVISGITPTIDPLPTTGKIHRLTGTGNAGTIITVYKDDTELGTTIVDDAGNWNLKLNGKRSIRSRHFTVTSTSN